MDWMVGSRLALEDVDGRRSPDRRRRLPDRTRGEAVEDRGRCCEGCMPVGMSGRMSLLLPVVLGGKLGPVLPLRKERRLVLDRRRVPAAEFRVALRSADSSSGVTVDGACPVDGVGGSSCARHSDFNSALRLVVCSVARRPCVPADSFPVVAAAVFVVVAAAPVALVRV